MEEIKVIFILDDINVEIKCSKENVMKNICQKFASKFNININSYLFLNQGKQINFNLCVKDYIDLINKINNEMVISVYKNDKIACPKCKEKILLNKEITEEIILNNNEMKEIINEIKLKIENKTKISSDNQNNIELNNFSNKLNIINEKIQNNNDKLIILQNDKNNMIEHITNNIDDYIVKNGPKDISDNNSKKCDSIEDKNNKINCNNKKLIKNIKSNYIIKKIFTHLNEKTKLKLIKHNISLQNKINIKLINYQLFNCR